jgi:hypothetical protein
MLVGRSPTPARRECKNVATDKDEGSSASRTAIINPIQSGRNVSPDPRLPGGSDGSAPRASQGPPPPAEQLTIASDKGG